MKKGISKNRPKGAEYGRIKSHEKLARKLEDKKRVGQIENAKKNAVRRKEKEAKKEFYDMIDEIKVIDFIKNSFIILKEGEEEKSYEQSDQHFFCTFFETNNFFPVKKT